MNALQEFQYQIQRLDRVIHIAVTQNPQPILKEKQYETKQERLSYYSKILRQNRGKLNQDGKRVNRDGIKTKKTLAIYKG